jgi:hypothetical protein
LAQSLEMGARALGWIPHVLTDKLRQKPCILYRELLKMLKAQDSSFAVRS